MTIRWPVHLLPPMNDGAFNLVSRSLTGPASISGLSQAVASDAGLWKATFAEVRVRGRDPVLAFRAIGALLEGRQSAILVPLCRGYQPTADASLFDAVPHDDESLFSDGSGYVGGGTLVTLAADAAVRATQVGIVQHYGEQIQPGQHFSIGDRLYRVRSVTTTGEGAATITFRPTLRGAASAGTELNFDDPICRMKLLDDAQMDLDLQMRRVGRPTVSFIEDL